MNNNVKNFIIFAVGAAIGSAVTWNIAKARHKADLEEVRTYYREKYNKPEDGESDTERVMKNLEETKKVISEYRAYAKQYESNEEDEEEMEPYVITPDEFSDSEYETVSLTYYADGILTDDNDVIIEDIESCVGSESLDHFGEYEEDSVFVRNDEKEIDYEILRDLRKYRDVYGDYE